ncbi:MAG: CBS domain-containing protein [Anaerolineaceae bacterium]|nr:CBS domain-containing protein [Anaerolineaceae bacterium]MBN2678023.1 CBS domain-containing protein [Anaerolineaceae bacterium]
MTKNPVCCVPDDGADRVAQMMGHENIGSIPVVENMKTKKLIGIVTDRDLALKIVAEGRDNKTTTVETVMTHKVVTCRAEDDLQVALNAMSTHQLRRIPVVDNKDQILGIIAQADVATRIDQPEKVAELLKDISQSKTKSSNGPVMKWLDPRKITLKQIIIMIALLLLVALVVVLTLVTTGA